MPITWNARFQRWEAPPNCKPASAAGFAFSQQFQTLWTNRPKVAGEVKRWMTGEARFALDAALDNIAEQILASAAGDATLRIQCPAGQAYLGYQKACVSYCLARENVLIADEMGLGKTIEAIAVANAIPSISMVLIVCPAYLQLNWLREWRKWSMTRILPTMARKHFPINLERRAVIISYAMLKKWRERIMSVTWDLLICDEAHALINLTAQRTKMVCGIRHAKGYKVRPIQAKRRLFLTGSPLVNRPGDLYPMMTVLDPYGLGRSKIDFYKNFVWTTDNLAELNSTLRARVMIRRLKADVMTELPPKRRQLVTVEIKDESKILAAEAEVIELVRRNLAEAEKYETSVLKLGQAKKMALSDIAKIRHATALAKVPAVIEHLAAILQEQDKLVVFAHHHDVVDAIHAAFPKIAVVLDGRVLDPAKGQAIVDRFQADPRCRLFIGSIRKMQGWTLTAASVCAFAELDWTPTSLNQAEDRLHRHGQKDNVTIYHFVVDGSIDCKMAKINMAKQALMNTVLDGEEMIDNPEIRSILHDILWKQ